MDLRRFVPYIQLYSILQFLFPNYQQYHQIFRFEFTRSKIILFLNKFFFLKLKIHACHITQRSLAIVSRFQENNGT